MCRLENGETGADGKPVKTYRQRHKTQAGYVNNVKGIRQVPYRLPKLVQAIAQEKTVFIVEGEKCADAIVERGGAATCNAMGAGKWPDSLTPHFKGVGICVVPDNDEPGTKHAETVARKLQGVAKRVRILELPGLPPKGDVADWIAAGGTLDKLYELAETSSREPAFDSFIAIESTEPKDEPLPLFPVVPDAEPFPLEHLGVLARAAKAITSKVQVPGAMAAQSVLAATSLVACAHADVMLPFGQARPLALYFVSVAASGDRKSAADNEAALAYPQARAGAARRIRRCSERMAHRTWRMGR